MRYYLVVKVCVRIGSKNGAEGTDWHLKASIWPCEKNELNQILKSI